MGIINASQTLVGYDPTHGIRCQDVVQVKLSVTASPNITPTPNDIALVLERSVSSVLTQLIQAASTIVDIIYNNTGGTGNQIAGGTRIGIVSFSDTAAIDLPLTTDIGNLKNTINSLTPLGSPNVETGFTKAMELLSGGPNPKVIILLSTGQTADLNASFVASNAAKAAGIPIYCIGVGLAILGSLYTWSSGSGYFAPAPDPTGLQNLFGQFARSITLPGATNISIDELINTSNFAITAIGPPTTGSITPNSDPTTGFTWTIHQLAAAINETAEVIFIVKPSVFSSGTYPVNSSILYADAEKNQVAFNSPNIWVNCVPTPPVVITQPCPAPASVTIDGCEDSKVIIIDNGQLQDLGRILEVDVTIKDVCPNKRIALAVLVYEVDVKGTEYKRGIKILTIPAHHKATCEDITVQCIKFVLPEDLDVTGFTTSICNRRNFLVRVLANSIDFDYECCKRPIT